MEYKFLFQVNPMKLVARVKKIQEEVSSMNEQCRELLAAKQVFVNSLFFFFFLCIEEICWGKEILSGFFFFMVFLSLNFLMTQILSDDNWFFETYCNCGLRCNNCRKKQTPKWEEQKFKRLKKKAWKPCCTIYNYFLLLLIMLRTLDFI